MTPHSSSSAQRTSRSPQVSNSHVANFSQFSGYGHSSQVPLPFGQCPPPQTPLSLGQRPPPQTPLPLGQRPPSDIPAHIRAPMLATAPAGNNFPYPSQYPSWFVPAPSQPSPTDQRKRAISFGPKSGQSSTAQVSRSSDSRDNQRSKSHSTHPSSVTTDGHKGGLAAGRSSTQASKSSNSRETQRFNSRSIQPSYGHKGRAAAGDSSTAQVTSSSGDSRDAQHCPSHNAQSPMLTDVALVAAVAAANADHREFPWYTVWNIAIKDHMFSRCNTTTVACNLVPQYVLQREYDPSSSANSSPVVPCKNPREWVIPDFALVLQHIRHCSDGSAMILHQRVIVIVENKPKREKRVGPNTLKMSPFTIVESQTGRQAVFAFTSDPTLNTIGVITTFGDVWQYCEIERPVDTLPSSWSEAKDPTWGTEESDVARHVPTFLRNLSRHDWFTFDLMDRSGKSAVAFKYIVDRIKERERDFWNLR